MTRANDDAELQGLRDLEARVHKDLELLDHPKGEWVPPRRHKSGTPVYDVVVVGGGQAGLAILFALARENVTNTIAIDRSPAGHEGPWLTFARMETLRTNKNITGPALGVPSLTPRAWYSAAHGAAAWDGLERIPRTAWQAYLDWFGQTLDLPVRNETEAGPLEPENEQDPGSLIRVPLRATGPSGRSGLVFAREVVLANGIEGCGEWHIPDIVSDNLPPDRYVQANTVFDLEILRSKRIVVIGANASGFDAASAAFEHGATHVDLLARRAEIPKVNAHRPLDSNAWHRHFADLDTETRWRLAVHVMRNNQPPPQDSFDRALRHTAFELHEDAGIVNIVLQDSEIVIETVSGQTIRADFLVAATGFVCDLSRRVETSAIARRIALWKDRFTPPEGVDWAPMGNYPWLDDHFAFTEKNTGVAPWLHHIRCFSLGTLPSLGMTGGSASSIRHGVPRLAQAVTRQLFLDDRDHHVAGLLGHDDVDLITGRTR